MQARCLCGEVVWAVEGPIRLAHHCHCSRCQKSIGTGYSTMGAVPVDALRWLQGGDGLRRYESSPGLRRPFCGRCGSSLPGDPWRDLVFVPLGPLEGELELKVEAHFFTASKAPWLEIRDGLPAYDAFPPGVEDPKLGALGRGHSAGGRIGGSCLCGEVAWECEGAPELLRHCHCLRCRRARSAAHASNAFVAPERFHWTRGEERVTLFRLPEAARFSQAFCSGCGSKVPWLVVGRDRFNLPAGGFDDDPLTRPREHIFVGSKASWHRIHDDLPRFEEYGPT